MADLSLVRSAAVKGAFGATGLPSGAVAGAAALAEQLAREMADAWRAGDRPLAESFLDRHPEVRADPEAALRLIYEEICLRQEYEPTGGSLEVMRRFPQWQGELRGLLDCVDLLRPRTAAPSFPAIDETLDDFRVVKELGRGALGRVFLALQHSLADRPVVLKMTPCSGEEHLTLARLQHTNIVPLYSARDFPNRNLRVLCMPYLGGASLAAVLSALAPLPPRQRNGRLILEELDRTEEAVGVALPRQEKGRRLLAESTYEQAVCRGGEHLARALQYAHDRGMVHLDLKPSNVLLAGDAEPMLLDFHLARGPVRAGDRSPDWLGGTPGYMSPEQEAALEAVRAGRPVPADVDGRSDVYSLGVLLYEALGGEPPPPGVPAGALRDRNPNVSVGLEDVIRKCLARDPAGRYPDPTTLADDLRRHLKDLPLRGVPNRSLGERWRKWRRRRPQALAVLVVSLALTGALLGAAGLFFNDAVQRLGDARRALDFGREQMSTRQFPQAANTFEDGLARLGGLAGSAGVRQALERDLRHARRADRVLQLHQLAEGLRYFAVLDSWSVRDRRNRAAACEYVWRQRRLLTDRAGAPLENDLEENVAPDLTDLVLLGSDLRIDPGDPQGAPAVCRQTLDDLAEVEALTGPSHVLARARQTLLARLGLAEEARRADADAARLPPRWAWEHCAVGRTLLRQGEAEAAERELRRAAELDPSAFWPRFYGGVCAYRRGRHAEALRAFDRCAGAAPESSECHYFLGLVCVALGHTDEAEQELDAAIGLRSAPGAVYLERGRLHAQQGRPTEALDDFKKALDRGGDPAVTWFRIAGVQASQKQVAEARASLRRALDCRPGFRQASELLAALPAE